MIEKNNLKYVSSSYVGPEYSLFYESNHRPSQRGYHAWLWSLYHRPSNDLSDSFITAYNRLDSQGFEGRLRYPILHPLKASPQRELSSLSKLQACRCHFTKMYIYPSPTLHKYFDPDASETITERTLDYCRECEYWYKGRGARHNASNTNP